MRAPEILGGRYELLEVIGRGGMGVVHRAQDRMLDRTVAVKVLPAEYADVDTLVERFEREARAAARLNHPNIVAVFDTGRDGTVRYIVMEYVPGLSLAQRLRGSGPLPVPEAIEVAAQMASALAAAHSAGIIHRDIKPANVMLAPSGTAKVLDFGIARATAEAALTATTTLLGSAPYMAPEIALGQPADARSDVYSLGCVLYEMLAGRPPFTGDLPVAVMNQHTSAPPQPPRELNSALPPAVDALILRMLAKEPADRPQEAGGLVTELRSTLAQSAPTGATTALAPTAATARVAPPALGIPPTPPAAAAAAAERRVPPRRTGPLPPPPGGEGSRSPWMVALILVVVVLAGVAIAVAATAGSGGGTSTSSTPSGTTTTTPTSRSVTSSTTPSTSSTRSQTTPTTTTSTRPTTSSTTTSRSTSTPSGTTSPTTSRP